MITTTLANLRAHKARLLLSSLAIVISVGFVAGTFVFTGAMKHAFFGAYAEDLGEADVVVTATEEQASLPNDVLATVRGVEGVAHVAGRVTGRAAMLYPDGRLVRDSYGTAIVSIAQNSALRWQDSAKGTLPDERGEAVLDRGTAQRAGLTIGDRIRVPLDWGETPTGAERSADGRGSTSPPLRIVGLVNLGGSPQYAGTPFLGITVPQAKELTQNSGYGMALALGADGVPADVLSDRVASAVLSSYVVRTGEEQARHEMDKRMGNTLTTITLILLAFAGVAMFVAAIVIANTFSILLAQRTRELALLRCVAATRGQIFRSVLLESAILGLVGSATGTMVGYGLATGVGSVLHASLDNFPFATTTPTVTAVIVPIVVGVAVTLTAAVLPARSATRIAPVAALRDQSVPRRRAGGVRLTLAVLALTYGIAGLVSGTLAPLSLALGFVLAFSGGIAAFGGVLLAGPVVIPPAIRLAGTLLARLIGTPGRLAAANAVRNPRRASATTSALLVGATLITMMMVGAASARETMSASLDEQYPVDYAIGVGEAHIPGSVAAAVSDVPGIAGTATLRRAESRVGTTKAAILGVDPARLSDVTAALPKLRQLRPGTVALTESLATKLAVQKGDAVRLHAESGHARRFEVSAVQQRVGIDSADAAVAAAAFDSLFPGGGQVGLVVAELAEEADARQVTAAIHEVTADKPAPTITGAAEVKASHERVLDTLLLITTALLGIAVLIALIGIANTLSLSVIERTRESGLLRAVGLTRGQLRGMLAGEAMLFGLVGGLLGVGLGVIFGWVGVGAVLPSNMDVVLAIPGARVAALVAVAVVAALVASVLPARRASRASIVSAVTQE